MPTATRPAWKTRDWKTDAWRGLAVGGGDRSGLFAPSMGLLSVASFVVAIVAAVLGKWADAGILVGFGCAFAVGHFAFNGLATYAAKRGGMRQDP